MIKELKVEKLNGRFDYEFEFYEDLNLFAGHIGTGKTTLLKLIWFLTSGNLHRVISEIPFNFVSIETLKFFLSMEYGNSNQVTLIWEFKGDSLKVLLDLKQEASGVVVLNLKQEASGGIVLREPEQVEKLNATISHVMESSLFFPTFRRMERHTEDILRLFAEISFEDGLSGLRAALRGLADALSVDDHKFIVAASTYDLIDLLTEKNTEIAKGKKNVVDDDYDKLVYQWNRLDIFVRDIYTDYNGIHITDNIVLGAHKNKTENPIPSRNLSSGEKQLLGFLCHNAFSEAKSIFIDEPELSLHADWQRLIISMLEYQGTDSQFFASSHSMHIINKHKENLHLLGGLQGEN